MKSINEDLKNKEFKQVYLLYGKEDYLKRSYKNRLKDSLIGPEDSMNYSYYEGKNLKVSEIIDLAETMPFFSERRLIVIENSGLFKEDGQTMAEYINTMADTAYFLFIESEIDKRSKLFKAVKTKGRAVELGEQDARTLTQWILGTLKKEGKKITESTMQLFLDKTGTDMENIEKELEKLLCYTLEKEIIEAEDVEAVCTERITNQIFEMINQIADKQRKKALELYYDLLILKEPPMRILYLITRQFNLLLQVKDLSRLGYDKGVIGKKTGLPPFVIGKYISQGKRFSSESLREAIADCAAAEEEVKTGKLNDVMSVELLIIKYS